VSTAAAEPVGAVRQQDCVASPVWGKERTASSRPGRGGGRRWGLVEEALLGQAKGCHCELGTLGGGEAERIEEQIVLVGVGGVFVEVVLAEGLPVPISLLHPPGCLFGGTAEAALDRRDPVFPRPDQADAQGGVRWQQLGCATTRDDALTAHLQGEEGFSQVVHVGGLTHF